MMDNDQAAPRAPTGKKRYAPPRLKTYGDVRDLTLGPTPGLGESGHPGTFRQGMNMIIDSPGGSTLR